jgi:hypothetical protein
MNGIRQKEAFDPTYYKFGDAFEIICKETGRKKNGILLYCEDEMLTFGVPGYAMDSNCIVMNSMYIKIEDLKTTVINKLTHNIEEKPN